MADRFPWTVLAAISRMKRGQNPNRATPVPEATGGEEAQPNGKAAMRQLQCVLTFAAAVVAATTFSIAAAQTNPFEPAAIVDEQIITRYDVSQRAKQLSIDGGGVEDAYREQALEALISETLLRNAALQAGYTVTNGDVEARLSDLARSQGVSPAEIIAFFESSGVDALTVGRWLENQLLQEAYILRLFRGRAQAAVQPADIERELHRYEREQLIELRLHQIMFGRLNQDGLQEVRRLRSRIIQAMDDGARFPDIGAQIAANSSGVSYLDLGWQPDQAFQDPRLIDLVASLRAGSVTPPIEFGRGGVSLFFVQDKRIRTPPGVEPFRFDISILSAESPPGASNDQVEALVDELEAARDSDIACDESVSLSAGVERRLERNLAVDEMSLQNRIAVLDLEVGQHSEISLSDQRSGGGGALVWLFALCSRNGGFESEEAREGAIESVRQRLFNAQLALLGNEHVRELRQRASIEIR